jgi:hypothetical protein
MEQVRLSGAALGTLAVALEFAAQSGKYFHSDKGVLSEARSPTASYDERRAATL